MLSERTQNIMLYLEFPSIFDAYCHHEFFPCFGTYSIETSLEIHSLRSKKAYTRKKGSCPLVLWLKAALLLERIHRTPSSVLPCLLLGQTSPFLCGV